jgi:hypothetical protein
VKNSGLNKIVGSVHLSPPVISAPRSAPAATIRVQLGQDITADVKRSEGEWIEPTSPYPLARRRGRATVAEVAAIYFGYTTP